MAGHGPLYDLEDGAAVDAAAQDVADRLRRHEAPDGIQRAELAFVAAAREALTAPPGARQTLPSRPAAGYEAS
ncbi:hypothetical protein ABZ622_24640 [Streptomyces sp. NPDC007164]|uniref:hypothetical protein n=1 Tax=Streptomyces sp. NPDC007164 TaxID=3156918 RepID=UPI0033FAF7F3